MQETAQFTFSQEKAATLLQYFKRQSQRFFWGQTVNKVQVFPSEKTTIIDISNKQSLLIQPNLIPLDSVRMLAAEY